MKHFFVYRMSAKPGFTVALIHGSDPREKGTDKHLGPRILKVYPIPEDHPLYPVVDRGDCPWKALQEAFPPPASEE